MVKIRTEVSDLTTEDGFGSSSFRGGVLNPSAGLPLAGNFSRRREWVLVLQSL
jgi:hypothetical protein